MSAESDPSEPHYVEGVIIYLGYPPTQEDIVVNVSGGVSDAALAEVRARAAGEGRTSLFDDEPETLEEWRSKQKDHERWSRAAVARSGLSRVRNRLRRRKRR